MENCQHLDFIADVVVDRIQPKENMPVSHYDTTIKIKCKDCGQPFRFLCSRGGVAWNEPTVGILGDELRAPIHPNDGTEPLPPKIKGFTVNVLK